MNLHNIKRLLERKCLSLPKNIKSQNKSVAMEIKLDRKKNHIAASDYKEQTTVIKTTSDFKIGNNVDTNKIGHLIPYPIQFENPYSSLGHRFEDLFENHCLQTHNLVYNCIVR